MRIMLSSCQIISSIDTLHGGKRGQLRWGQLRQSEPARFVTWSRRMKAGKARGGVVEC